MCFRKKACLTIMIMGCLLLMAVPTFATDHLSITFNESSQTISVGLPGTTVDSASTGYGLVLGKYKQIGQGVAGICVLISLCALIFHITKLSAAGNNPAARQATIKGILFSCVALTLFGCLPLVLSFFLSLFNG